MKNFFNNWYSKYFGKLYFCPICEKRTLSFESFGVVSRKNARCPSCGSLERHRLFWLYLQRKTKLLARFSGKSDIRMLHVAPERCFRNRFRKIFGINYLAADLLPKDADVEKMDITSIQYPGGSFDFIYCSHVLEHVSNDRLAMKEFFRVLLPGGLAVLLVPITAGKTIEDASVTDPETRLRLFGQKDHVRRYGPDYVTRLIEAGFEVEVIGSEKFLIGAEIKKMGIMATEKIYACRKPVF